MQLENLTAAGPALCYQHMEAHSTTPMCLLQCRDALTTRQKLIAQDYKVSYSLAKSCKSDLKKYRCNVENLPRSREARLSYLLMCLESAVHRGKWSSRLAGTLIFKMRDLQLVYLQSSSPRTFFQTLFQRQISSSWCFHHCCFDDQNS